MGTSVERIVDSLGKFHDAVREFTNTRFTVKQILLGRTSPQDDSSSSSTPCKLYDLDSIIKKATSLSDGNYIDTILKEDTGCVTTQRSSMLFTDGSVDKVSRDEQQKREMEENNENHSEHTTKKLKTNNILPSVDSLIASIETGNYDDIMSCFGGGLASGSSAPLPLQNNSSSHKVNIKPEPEECDEECDGQKTHCENNESLSTVSASYSAVNTAFQQDTNRPTDNMPYHQNNTPYHQNNTPYHQNNAPYHQNNTPYHQNNAPYHQNNAPYHPDNTSNIQKKMFLSQYLCPFCVDSEEDYQRWDPLLEHISDVHYPGGHLSCPHGDCQRKFPLPSPKNFPVLKVLRIPGVLYHFKRFHDIDFPPYFPKFPCPEPGCDVVHVSNSLLGKHMHSAHTGRRKKGGAGRAVSSPRNLSRPVIKLRPKRMASQTQRRLTLEQPGINYYSLGNEPGMLQNETYTGTNSDTDSYSFNTKKEHGHDEDYQQNSEIHEYDHMQEESYNANSASYQQNTTRPRDRAERKILVLSKYCCPFCVDSEEDYQRWDPLLEHISDVHYPGGHLTCPHGDCQRQFPLPSPKNFNTLKVLRIPVILHHFRKFHGVEYPDYFPKLHCPEPGCDVIHVSNSLLGKHVSQAHPTRKVKLSAGCHVDKLGAVGSFSLSRSVTKLQREGTMSHPEQKPIPEQTVHQPPETCTGATSDTDSYSGYIKQEPQQYDEYEHNSEDNESGDDTEGETYTVDSDTYMDDAGPSTDTVEWKERDEYRAESEDSVSDSESDHESEDETYREPGAHHKQNSTRRRDRAEKQILVLSQYSCPFCVDSEEDYQSWDPLLEHISDVHYPGGHLSCPHGDCQRKFPLPSPKNFPVLRVLRIPVVLHHFKKFHNIDYPHYFPKFPCPEPGCDVVHVSNSLLGKHVTSAHLTPNKKGKACRKPKTVRTVTKTAKKQKTPPSEVVSSRTAREDPHYANFVLFREHRCMMCDSDPLYPNWDALYKHILDAHFTLEGDGRYVLACPHQKCLFRFKIPSNHKKSTKWLLKRRLPSIVYHFYCKHDVGFPSYVNVFTCPEEGCTYSHVVRSTLEKHRAGHNVDPASLPPAAMCDLCGKESRNKHFLSYHKAYYCKAIERPDTRYKCAQCDKDYRTPDCLRTHIKRSHLDMGPKLVCQYCSKVLTSQTSLNQHIFRVHGQNPTDQPVVTCPHCPYQLFSAKKLQKHINQVHRVQSFTCEICQQNFCKIDAYSRHMETHSDHVYQCELCSYSTKHKRCFYKHQQAQHSEKRYNCNYCSYTSGYRENTMKHMRHCAPKHGELPP